MKKNLVTFSLVNNLKAKKSDKVSKTENTLFQLEFSISIMEGEILKYPSSSHFLPVTDEERDEIDV